MHQQDNEPDQSDDSAYKHSILKAITKDFKVLHLANLRFEE